MVGRCCVSSKLRLDQGCQRLLEFGRGGCFPARGLATDCVLLIQKNVTLRVCDCKSGLTSFPPLFCEYPVLLSFRLLRAQQKFNPGCLLLLLTAVVQRGDMSRFLEYGVFVPDPSKENSESSSPPSTGQWAQVGGKWAKVGPDGQPLVPPTPKSFSQTLPAGSSSSSSNGGEGGEGAEVQGGGSSAADPFSQTAGAAGSGGGDWERRKQNKEGGLANGDVYGHEGDGDDGGDDDDDSSPTIPRMRSSSSAAGSAAPRPTGSASSRGRGIYGSNNSSGEGGETEPGAGGGGGGGTGGGGSTNSGGLTVAVDANNNKNNNSNTLIDSAGGSSTAEQTEEGVAAARQRAMLTPGLSKSYSTDEIVGKFFGEDAAAAAAAGAGGAGGDGGGKAGSGDREGGELDFGASAACVGERAAAPGSSGKKGKHSRTGSGSSNTANSPVNRTSGEKEEDSEPVETRDVACQWDGSEFDASAVFLFVLAFASKACKDSSQNQRCVLMYILSTRCIPQDMMDEWDCCSSYINTSAPRPATSRCCGSKISILCSTADIAERSPIASNGTHVRNFRNFVFFFSVSRSCVLLFSSLRESRRIWLAGRVGEGGLGR